MQQVELKLLQECDREQFILDNQEAFRYGATEEFGLRDNHFEENGEIISRKTIENSIDNGIAYRILYDGRNVGGLVLNINDSQGELELLFVKPQEHNKGIGHMAWMKVEEMYPNVKLWETCTPYFEKRNIHFYVNRCGFHIVEFFNKNHTDSRTTDQEESDEMFRFEKRINI